MILGVLVVVEAELTSIELDLLSEEVLPVHVVMDKEKM